MAADLEVVITVAQVVGVVDHPCGEPQNLALQLTQHFHVVHGHSSRKTVERIERHQERLWLILSSLATNDSCLPY
jgi:hypothetical protein